MHVCQQAELESEQERYARFSKRADSDIAELRLKFNNEVIQLSVPVDLRSTSSCCSAVLIETAFSSARAG